jgi:hypothetical protein
VCWKERKRAGLHQKNRSGKKTKEEKEGREGKEKQGKRELDNFSKLKILGREK